MTDACPTLINSCDEKGMLIAPLPHLRLFERAVRTSRNLTLRTVFQAFHPVGLHKR